MIKVFDDAWFAGVDGCRAGWLLALVRPADGDVRLRLVPCFADVLAAPEAPSIIAVATADRSGPSARGGERRAAQGRRP
jgi:threonine dehydratase